MVNPQSPLPIVTVTAVPISHHHLDPGDSLAVLSRCGIFLLLSNLEPLAFQFHT